MKTLLLTFCLAFFAFAINAQNGEARPVTGAFWNDGIDGIISKHVHYNVTTEGDHIITTSDGGLHQIEVIFMDDKTKILFAEGNYANHNRNWVTANNGKRWRHKNSNRWRLAECGNIIDKIETPGIIRQVIDLAETNSRLERLEEGQAQLQKDNEVIVTNQKTLNRKVDRNYEAIIDNGIQIRRGRNESWVQTAIITGAVVVDGVVTRDHIRKNNKITNIYYGNSGNEGHHGNGILKRLLGLKK